MYCSKPLGLLVLNSCFLQQIQYANLLFSHLYGAPPILRLFVLCFLEFFSRISFFHINAMGNSLLCHYIDNCFKKGIILWGQKHCDWGGKVEEWGSICPPSYNVKKGSDAISFVHKYNPFKQASYPKGRVKVRTTQQQGRKLLLVVEGFMLLLPCHTIKVLYLQRSMRR